MACTTRPGSSPGSTGKSILWAAEFDVRDGNDYYARWFAGMKKLKALAIAAPLEENEPD